MTGPRVIIVGGGIMGLLTAEAAATRGAHVTLIEQGPLPPSDATSSDEHRIIRAYHPGEPAKTRAAQRAEHAWVELQRRIPGDWYARVGALSALPGGTATRHAHDLRALNVPHARLTPTTLSAQYPHVRWLPGHWGLIETHAGILLADHALQAITTTLKRRPDVRLLPGTRVTRVHAPTASVTLADGRVLTGDRLVITAGPWSAALLPRTQLRTFRQLLVYAAPSRHDATAWAGMPAVPSAGHASGAWFIPPVAGTHLKLTTATACLEVPHRDAPIPKRELTKRVLQAFRELLPDVPAASVTHTRTCTYLQHPRHPHPHLITLDAAERTVALVACGGSAFKFAPLIAASITSRLFRNAGARSATLTYQETE